jgi:hypothetical protein
VGSAVVCLALAACGTLLGASDDESSPPQTPPPDATGGETGGDDARPPDGAPDAPEDATEEDAQGTADAGSDVDAAGPLTVFISSQMFGVSEIATADSACNVLATNAGLGSGYSAWISYSDARGSAATRVPGNGPWRTPAGKTVFANRSALLGGTVTNALNVDQNGAVHTGSLIWTGTKANGTFGANCKDWSDSTASGIVGGAGEPDSRWTEESGLPPLCNTKQSVYCFQHP